MRPYTLPRRLKTDVSIVWAVLDEGAAPHLD